MPAMVTLRDTRTGFTRTFRDKHSDDEWNWQEGNYSCDCNRSIFLYELSVDDERVLPCGDGTIELVSIEVEGL